MTPNPPISCSIVWQLLIQLRPCALDFEMANLSHNDRNIIAEHPLDTFLDYLRESLRETEQSYKQSSFSFDSAAENPNYKLQEATSKLLRGSQGCLLSSLRDWK